MHIRYTAQKAGQELADAAPNISSLPGGLFDPSMPSQYQPLDRGTIRRTSSGIPREADELFVSEEAQEEPRNPAQQNERPRTPDAEYWETTLGLEQVTCYFWLQNGGRCANRQNCHFLHRARADIPTASRPPTIAGNFGPVQVQKTCYWWNLKKKCSKGDSCEFLHHYLEGIPVASAPNQPPPVDQREFSRQILEQENPFDDDGLRNDPSPVDSPMKPADKVPQSKPSGHDHPSEFPVTASPTEAQNLQFICYFWNLHGSCRKGDHCAYLHVTDPAMPVASNLHSDYICYFWNRDGSCTKGNMCNYLHVKDAEIPVAPSPQENRKFPRYSEGSLAERSRYTAPTPPGRHEYQPMSFGPTIDSYRPPTVVRQELALRDSEAEPLHALKTSDPIIPPSGPRGHKSRPSAEEGPEPHWDVHKPFNAICFFWNNSPENCINRSCKYFHRNDTSLPVQPDPRHPERVTCRFWAKGRCEDGNSCKYLHGFPPNVPKTAGVNDTKAISSHPQTELQSPSVPTAPRQKSVKFAVEEPMPFVEEPDSILASTPTNKVDAVCRKWKDGTCSFGRKCWFRHSYETGESPEMARNTGANAIPVASKTNMPNAQEPPMTEQSHDQPSSALIDEDVPPVFEFQSISTTKTKKPSINLGNYTRTQAIKALGARAKSVTIGDDKQPAVLLDVGELSQEPLQTLLQDFLSISDIRFEQSCIVNDFQSQQEHFQRQALWAGNIVPVDTGASETSVIINSIVEHLQSTASALVSILPDFTVLAYPARAEEWKFLEKSSDYPKGVRLRYSVFHSGVDVNSSAGNALELRPGSLRSPYRKTLMRIMHNLSFKNLLPIFDEKNLKTKNQHNFYLLFPSTANKTAESITSWLQASYFKTKVFSSQTEGSWEFFINNVDLGVILVHESVASDVCLVPKLSDILQTKTEIVWWNISDSSPPYPLFPSNYNLDDSSLGKIVATKLFPHGGTFLLTPSFIIAEPERTYSLLQWFFGKGTTKGKVDTSMARTWKIVCCFNFIDYLLDVANAKSLERDRFNEANKDNPSRDAKANVKGLGYEKCLNRYKLYSLMVDLQTKKRLGNSSDVDIDYYSGISDENESPIIYTDRYIDPDDEKALVDWYIGWSVGRLDQFRKFAIVGTTSPGSQFKVSRLKEFPASNFGFQKAQSLPAIAGPTSFSFPKTNHSLIPDASSQTIEVSPEKRKALYVAAKFKVPAKPKPSKLGYGHPPPSAASPRTQFGAEGSHLTSPAMSTGSSMSMDMSPVIKGNHKKDRGTPPTDLRGSELDAGIMKLIADSRPEDIASNRRDLPRLITAHMNADASLPNSATIVLASAETNPFSPTYPAISPFQTDGAGEDRPFSSGTDGSSTSRSGIKLGENGQRVVPRSVRPSGSVRKEITIKPGYIPPEDKESYRNRRVIDGISQYEIGSHPASAVASPAAEASSPYSVLAQSMGDKMNIDDPNASEDEDEVKEETEWREIQFEATTVWYEREGRGWGHVSVEGWEKTWKFLGISKK